MGLILGLIIASVGYHYAINHLGQTYGSYWDFVAFAVVWAGTLAVSIITMPKLRKRIIFREITSSIFKSRTKENAFVVKCMDLISNPGSTVDLTQRESNKLEFRVLRDGAELINLGFKENKIQEILEERILNHRSRVKTIADWIRGLAKYPPAFGLSGTVLGLIHLMRGVSEGMSPKETGIRMAIALVATFYGLIIANLFVNPLGESIFQDIKSGAILSDTAIEAVLLSFRKANLLEAQEFLNSHVDEIDKINFMHLPAPGEIKRENAA